MVCIAGLAEAFKDWTGEGAEKAFPIGSGSGAEPQPLCNFRTF